MGGNPDIFKMTIERKGKKVTLSGSEADVDAFWGLIRSHLSELDGACTNAQSTLAETPKEPLPSAQPVHTAPSISRGKLQFSHKRHELSGGKLRSKPRLLYAQEYAQPQRLSGFFR